MPLPKIIAFVVKVDKPLPPCVTEIGVVNAVSDVMSLLIPETAYERTVQLLLPGAQVGESISPGMYGENGGAANVNTCPEIKIIVTRARYDKIPPINFVCNFISND